MKELRPSPTLLLPLGLVGLLLALSAPGCKQSIDFPEFEAERCDDKVDNDEDEKIDCNDTDCEEECRVEVTIDQPTATTKNDTLRITGTHLNASTISISTTPSSAGGSATLSGDRWQFLLTQIATGGNYTITAVANGPNGLRDTATASFFKE